MRKKVFVLVMLSSLLMACGKVENNVLESQKNENGYEELTPEDKAVLSEISDELSEKNDDNAETEENVGINLSEGGVYACDPVVLNANWDDLYVQVCDVIVQEYHDIPLSDVVNKFLDSDIKYETDYDPEALVGSEDRVYLDSNYNERILLFFEKPESDSPVKYGDCKFTYLFLYSDLRYKGEDFDISKNSYYAKGFRLDGANSGYKWDDIDGLIGEDAICRKDITNGEFHSYFDNCEIGDSRVWYRADPDSLTLKIGVCRKEISPYDNISIVYNDICTHTFDIDNKAGNVFCYRYDPYNTEDYRKNY